MKLILTKIHICSYKDGFCAKYYAVFKSSLFAFGPWSNYIQIHGHTFLLLHMPGISDTECGVV
jgi:hypothetical protein